MAIDAKHSEDGKAIIVWFNKACVFSLGLRNVVRAANHCQQTRPPWFSGVAPYIKSVLGSIYS